MGNKEPVPCQTIMSHGTNLICLCGEAFRSLQGAASMTYNQSNARLSSFMDFTKLNNCCQYFVSNKILTYQTLSAVSRCYVVCEHFDALTPSAHKPT